MRYKEVELVKVSEMYYKENLKQAKQYFQDVINKNPQGALADDAKYRIAIIFYEQGDENKSIKVLARLKDQYPDSEIIPTADLKMAEILIEKRDFVEAKKVLEGVIGNFSGTVYVNVASKYYGDILRKTRKWRQDPRWHIHNWKIDFTWWKRFKYKFKENNKNVLES